MFQSSNIECNQKMTKNAFTLIEIISVVTVIALLSALAASGVVRAMFVARDDGAIQNLRTISLAFSDYASQNFGKYPANETELTSANPPYLNQAFCGKTMKGFTYSCNFNQDTYRITALYATSGGMWVSRENLGYYIDQRGNVVEVKRTIVAAGEGIGVVTPPPGNP